MIVRLFIAFLSDCSEIVRAKNPAKTAQKLWDNKQMSEHVVSYLTGAKHSDLAKEFAESLQAIQHDKVEGSLLKLFVGALTNRTLFESWLKEQKG